jgi:hypothetical protein
MGGHALKIPQRVALQSPIRQLRVEYLPIENGIWRIWLTANGDFTLGTFIQLCDNGTINRVTWHEDGTETVFEVQSDEELSM